MPSGLKKKRAILYALEFLLVIALDQWFKGFIVKNIPLNATMETGNIPLLPGVIHLTYIQNRGAAFGMMEGGRWLFLLLLAVFCAMVVWAVVTGWLEDEYSRQLAVLAMGGAVANGIDRLLYGYVVDMFETEFIRFAVFNIADAVMCVCAALFLIHLLRQLAQEKKN